MKKTIEKRKKSFTTVAISSNENRERFLLSLVGERDSTMIISERDNDVEVTITQAGGVKCLLVSKALFALFIENLQFIYPRLIKL